MKSPYLIVALICLIVACAPQPQEEKTKDLSSWMITGFTKVDSLNPILTPSSEQEFTEPIDNRVVRWEERNVLNPAAVVKDDKVYLFYRAQDSTGTSRIGLAVSTDGLTFEKSASPVFYPAEDSMKIFEWNYQKFEQDECINCFDGVEDPRIVETEEGSYIMTYTSYDGKTARLSLAVSDDLYQWEKKGLVLAQDEYRDTWSKAGAIVVRKEGNRMVATKINGKYWMYYGDTDLFLASSDDLIHWEPSINKENGNRISVMHPRPGYFDSRLVEPGPYAMLTDQGIVMIYNGSNAANFNDPKLPVFTYAAGQALFDKEAPEKLIDRSENYFIYPDKEYEKVGEVNLVCFVEGLVSYQGQWFLYYGTADSRIAVAVAPITETY